MERGTRLFLLFLCGTAVAVGLVLSREPRYKGKTTEEWFDSIVCHQRSVSPRDPAVLALVSMGEDAVPFLFRKFQSTYSPKREAADRYLNQFRGIKVDLGYYKWTESESRDWLKAVVCLEQMGDRAAAIVPDLITMYGSEDGTFRYSSLAMLAALHTRPELTLPAFQDMLLSEDINSYRQAMQGMAAFGPRAKPVLPAVIPFLYAGNSRMNGTHTFSQAAAESFRMYATSAIAQIAPDSHDSMLFFQKLIAQTTNVTERAEILASLARQTTNQIPSHSDYVALWRSSTNASVQARLAALLKSEAPELAHREGVE